MAPKGPKGGSTDAIGVVEAAYDLESTEEAWLRRLVDAGGLDRGTGAAAYVYDERIWATVAAARSRQRIHYWDVPEAFVSVSDQIVHSAPVDFARWLHASAPTLTTVIETMGGEHNHITQNTRPLGVVDGRGVLARDGAGSTVVLQGLSRDVVHLTPPERNLWELLAVHIGAGHRLRRLLGSTPTLEDESVEAVLDPGGRVVDARARAEGPTARAALRDATRRIDRARSEKGRQAPEEALDLWRGLTSGRWSLVDHFDSDGRRYVVARRNDPQVPDPRALTLRQRQVAAQAALGRPNKLIAYTLGISAPAVSTHLREALRKLGLESVAALRAATYPMPDMAGFMRGGSSEVAS